MHVHFLGLHLRTVRVKRLHRFFNDDRGRANKALDVLNDEVRAGEMTDIRPALRAAPQPDRNQRIYRARSLIVASAHHPVDMRNLRHRGEACGKNRLLWIAVSMEIKSCVPRNN